MRAASAICITCLLSIAQPARATSQAPARDRPEPAGTAVVRGRVTLAGSDQPLARVDVRATSAALKTPRTVKTDAGGRYEISGLPAGRYVVSASKPNFVDTAFGQKRPAGPGMPFELADGQVASNVDLAMARAGVITGRVVDEFGDPLVNVQVAAVRESFINGERRVVPARSPVVSNDLGEFRLFGIAPGNYYVAAMFRAFDGGDTNDRSGYARTYFPGTGNIAEAQRFAVAPGQTIAGLTIPLLQIRTTRISGTAIDSSGKPLNGFTVVVSGRDPFSAFRNSTVKPDGTFSVSGLPPGDYDVNTVGGDDSERAGATVSTSGGDVDGLQLVAVKPTTVSGRVVFDGSAAVPRPATVQVIMRRELVRMGNASATPRDDFSFELKPYPGRVSVSAVVGLPAPNMGGFAVPAADWRVKRVLLNGQDVTDTGFDVLAGTPVAGLVVEMTTRMGELSGVVASDNGEPERDCWVIAFAEDPRRWQMPTRYVVATRPGEDDRFHLRLPDGQYLVAAVSNIEPGEWQDPELLSRVQERATAFSIAEGERKSVELRVVNSR